MPWINPVNPTPGTVITAAFAIANWLDPIRWLRLMTGNADPPATGYVVTSDSVSATSWKTGTAAIGGVLGYTPANAAGQVFAGPVTSGWPLTVNASPVAGSGGRLILGGDGVTFTATVDVETSIVRIYSSIGKFLNFNLTNGALHTDGSIDTFGNVAASQLISAVPLGTPPLSVGSSTQVPNLNASFLANRIPGAAAGNLPILDAAGKVAAAVAADNAAQVGGRTPTSTKTPNSIPISDASGTLDAWVTPASFSIPSGLGCWVRTAAEIPAGFARETSLDGLMLIGAGTSFSQTFNETQTYGNTWAHTHTDSGHAHGSASHTHGASALGVAGNVAASSSTLNGRFSAGGATALPDNHIHDAGSLDVTGSTDGASLTTNNGSAVISSVTWIPPLRAVVWARKS